MRTDKEVCLTCLGNKCMMLMVISEYELPNDEVSEVLTQHENPELTGFSASETDQVSDMRSN